jgi:hypothetical protein
MNTCFRVLFRRHSVKLSIISGIIVTLSGCAMPGQMASKDAALTQCLVDIRSQQEAHTQHQETLMKSINAIREQLNGQDRLLQSAPRVIQKETTKVVCAQPKSEPKPFATTPTAPLLEKQIVGLKEQILLTGINVTVPARINVNTANSILDARNIQMFERNGEEWVRFTFYNPETQEPVVLERKRIRFQSVNTSTATNERRPVVEMRFMIGRLNQISEFILADRSTSEEPLVLGRNSLRDVMLVDVSGNNLAPVQRVDDATIKAQ